MNSMVSLLSRVKDLDKTILDSCLHDSEIDKLYKGCQVFYGPLIKKPEVLFVGLNPGSGYYGEHGLRVQKFDPEIELEYIKGNYSLAREIKDVFKKAQKSEKLDCSTKINHYFLATDNQRDLWKLLGLIKNNFQLDIDSVSKECAMVIVSECMPKIIVCEGKKSFELFVDRFNVRVDSCSLWKDGCASTEFNGAKVIGFKRLFSNIVDKDSLSSLL
ncbi:hypothetical protein [Solidesulfovibrio magneticus]|uniref:Uracil-DNA glycosylase-like domain-containing protein n=1 Tax=Solidesulfovibrio magneticus (strain ATCC 700980 / DSM 13731 / RS-1) TaxID=573370 RepID=C4XHX3_SOLM1|nr:hypothetical protein [Solidesulfovibrio magneticus]BAH76491.1 hypothetical protein DMR_30000 [Solidesulfovibrio magneticus RS-1]